MTEEKLICKNCNQEFINTTKTKPLYCPECKKKSCSVCKKIVEETKTYNRKRFCLTCYKKVEKEAQKEDLFEYMCQVFSYEEVPLGIKRQINNMMSESKTLTYEDIKETIKYIIEIKNEKLEKGLSAVPYYIEEMKKFKAELEAIATDAKEAFRVKKPEEKFIKVVGEKKRPREFYGLEDPSQIGLD